MKFRDTILNILQKSLANQVKPDSHVNPQLITDTLIELFDIEQQKDKARIVSINSILQAELKELLEMHRAESNVLLKNFIYGKVTATQELLERLKTH